MKLCIQLSSDSSIKSFSYEKDPIKVYQIIRNISRYSFTNNFIDDVFILFKEDAFFYSANGAQSLGYFHETNIGEDCIPIAEFTEALYSSDYERIWTLEKGIVLTYPYPFQFRNSTGVILFMISNDTLDDYLPIENNEKICVSSYNGKVIYGDPGLMGGADESQLIIHRQDGKGWEYRLLLDHESLHGNIAPLKRFFFITLSVILIIGFAVSTLVTFYQYLPIRRMSTYFKDNHGISGEHKDEFEMIKSSFLSVIKQEEDLRQEMKEREVIFKRDIVSRLINGRITDRTTLRKAGIAMDFPYYTVVLIRLSPAAENEYFDDYTMVGWKCEEGDFISHIITTYNNPSEQIALVGQPADNLLDQGNLTGLRKHWGDNIQKDVSLFLSSPKGAIEQIGEAYLEALTVKTNQRTENLQTARYYSDLSPVQGHVPYPYDTINQLSHALEHRRTAPVKKAGEALIEILKKDELDIVNSRRLYFNTVNTLLTGLQKDRMWNEGDIPIPDLFMLDRLDSVKDMIDLIDKSIKRVIELFDMKEDDRPVYLKELIDYLNDNYTDPNLSLQSLSDYFHLTPAYLSASFKKHNHCNISDYIGDLRIKRAKEMLISSDIPLKQIVVSLGYTDTSSFIRKFKSRESITPGEFRMNHSSSINCRP